MSEEVKNESKINLQFGDSKVVEEEQKVEDVNEAENVEIKIDDSMLSEEEKNAVAEFASQIDVRNTQAIMEYGSGVQKKMADFSSETLTTVRAKDLGQVGELMAQVVGEVKNFDDSMEKKGFLGLFKKAQVKATTLKARYDKAEVSIGKICDSLENHQATLLKDVAIMDKMYDLNLDTYKELTMYILAGKQKLEELEKGELQQLKQTADETGLPEDAQKFRDLKDQCQRFEKKLFDLELSRSIAMQTAPQIRMIQSADTQMAEKIQSVIVNTIPLWKNQMVITLSVAHSTQAIEAEKAVTDATNELLKKNAEQLHLAGTEAAKANQRALVDIETLKQTNQTLITTLTDVMKIQENGREMRAKAEIELQQMEGDLKQKLLEISTKTE